MNIKLCIMAFASAIALHANARQLTKSEARQVANAITTISDNSNDNVKDAPYYVFSRGKGQGFVIVSGDDEITPILGIVDNGDFIVNDMPEAMLDMLNGWAEKITSMQKSKQNTPNYAKHRAPYNVAARLAKARKGVEGYKTGWTDIAPLIQTHWHQNSPYNDICPVMDNGSHTLTGCVATAGSQLIYYFHKDNPDTLIYSTPTYSYGTPVTVSLPAGTPIEYNLMKLSGKGTTAQDRAVATLMYAVGTSTWLTYGSSTSGHTTKLSETLSGQFRLNNEYGYKGNYSQQAWEQKLYASLSDGKPVSYAGVHPTNGGHEVIVDGYQSSTGLYHFNFGWGNQGDGYYTVDDETGMNGFNGYQEAIFNITPKFQNLKGYIVPGKLYVKANSNIAVVVKNNGTLAYSGIKVFVSNNNILPSMATLNNTDTYIASGDSAVINVNFKPLFNRTQYIFLTDANNRILDSTSIEVENTKADLTLRKVSISHGTKKQVVDGMEFVNVNNTSVTFSAQLYNGENGTYCQPTLKCHLYQYDKDNKTWSLARTSTLSNTIFNTNDEQTIDFTINTLQENTLYKAVLDKTVKAGEESELGYATADTVRYFTVTKSTLQMTKDGSKATVTGAWDATAFNKLNTDNSITSYDMSAVSELTEQPKATNPNALFIATTPINKGRNIIVNEECDNLEITKGYPFAPVKTFKAKKATFYLNGLKPATWDACAIPFAVDVPSGMLARSFNTITVMRGTSSTVNKIEAMTPVFYMISDDQTILTADNVTINTETTATAAEGKVSVSTVNTTATDNGTYFGEDPNHANSSYFLPLEAGSNVAPFQVTSSVYNTAGIILSISPYYKSLAESIYKAITLYRENENKARPTALSTLNDTIIKAQALFTEQPTSSKQVKLMKDNVTKAIDAFLEDVATSITEINKDVEDNIYVRQPEYYTIDGRRISTPAKGIYIEKRGNKVVKRLKK